MSYKRTVLAVFWGLLLASLFFWGPLYVKNRADSISKTGDVENKKKIYSISDFQSQDYDMNIVLMSDTRAFLPINLNGTLSDNPEEILDLLNEFEDYNKVEILNWMVEQEYYSYGSHGMVYGIWVDYKPWPKNYE